MAGSTNNCGYDANFATAIPEELKCVICHLVLREPVQVMTCGHRFCAPCFDRMKIHSQETNVDLLCPVDREIIMLGHVFPDRAASRTIGNFKVHCGNCGCEWIDDLRNLRDHEEECKFKVVGGIKDGADGSIGEVNVALKQVLSRLQAYDEDLLMSHKELSQLKYTVSELAEDKKLKDEEIRLLKMSNVELRAESTMRDKEMNELKITINKLQNELECMKQSSGMLEQNKVDLQLKDDITVMNEINKLQLTEEVQRNTSNIEEEVKAVKEEIDRSISVLKNEISILTANITEDKELKDEEIRLLKMSNVELRGESAVRDKEGKELMPTINKLQSELEHLKQCSDQHDRDIITLQSRSVTAMDENEKLRLSDEMQKEISSIKEEVKTAKEKIDLSITSLGNKSSILTENIENVQFSTQQVETKNDITFNWVMKDYLHMFRIGNRVCSPTFNTMIGGYSFQIVVGWSGPNKDTLGVFLGLRRGTTPHRFLDEFNHEFTLTIHGKAGRNKATGCTRAHMTKFHYCFVIRKGEDQPQKDFGFDILTAPFDDFIINNSLLISCVIHLKHL